MRALGVTGRGTWVVARVGWCCCAWRIRTGLTGQVRGLVVGRRGEDDGGRVLRSRRRVCERS